jgi:histidinol-phosphate aminotransferase
MILPKDIEKLIRPEVKAMPPYVPIEPTEVISRRLGVSEGEVIKLDGNENPYGCSPRVKRALARYAYYHLYPDPEQRELRSELEKYTGISVQYLLAGSGSDELIDLILRLFIQPRDKVVNCPPTFGMYPFSTDVCGGKAVSIPRKADFSIDTPSALKAINSGAKIIFVASPNNPSGNITPVATVLELLKGKAMVIVDEAYFEFSGVTVAPLVLKYSNLIVLRTFSKWAGLAGLRVGYGIFPANIVEYLMKIKQPYNLNVAAQVAAMESLRDLDYLRGTIKAIVKERERLMEKLVQLDWLKVYPSQSNFILCRVLKGNAAAIHKELQKQGIFIRYFDAPQLKDCLRISVGKREHTDKLIAALKRKR